MPFSLLPPHRSRWLAAATLAATLAAAAAPASAKVRVYPGPDCPGTLQACVDAAEADDHVQLAEDLTLPAPLTLSRPLRLGPTPGQRVRVTGRIALVAPAPGTYRLEHLDIDGGLDLDVDYGLPSDLDVRLDGLHLRPPPNGLAIGAWHAGSGAYDLAVRRTRITLPDSTNGIAALALYVSTFDDAGPMDVELAFATIEAGALVPEGAANSLVEFYGSSAAGLRVRVHGSTLSARSARRLLRFAAGSGPLAAVVADTVLHGAAEAVPFGATLEGTAAYGQLDLEVMTTTVLGGEDGIVASLYTDEDGQRPGAATLRIRNTLVAGTRGEPLAVAPGVALAATDSRFLPPSADGALPADVGLAGLDDPRPRAGSSLARAGDGAAYRAVLSAWNLPGLDPDGEPRRHGETMTLGAHDADVRARTLALAPAFDGAALAGLDPDPARVPLLTGHVTAPSADAPTQPVRPWAVSGASFWRAAGAGGTLQAQTLLARQGARPPLVRSVPAGAGARLSIDDPELAGRPDAVLYAGLLADDVSAVAPQTLGVIWDAAAATWAVFTLDGTPLPAGAKVVVQHWPPDAFAFRVRTDGANLRDGGFVLRHPLLDDEPCARVLLTPSLAGFGGPLGATRLRALETPDGRRWRIERVDGSGLAFGEVHHVVIDRAAIADCRDPRLLTDGFE